ncbi:myoneurin-like isoform X4 [Ochlerotatus camptorhynchus]|uniref:myoneurin-like isoform X4 n=1 Tax=Ochlerotatus camptorhynchus TaxID=644619 RepID=UPI0031D26865
MDAVSCEIKKEKSDELICRLCFLEREHFRLIFIDTYSSLDEWIENLTSLKISEVPGAPAALCLECQNMLQNFESFREMCFTNDRVFKEMFTQNDHTGVTETSSVNQLVATKMDAVSCEIKKEKSAELICRLCFMEREHYRLIFIDTYSSLDEWIENLTSLKIFSYPNAPASLCSECKTVLKNFESFREMCITNDVVFKDLYIQDVQPTKLENSSAENNKVDQNASLESSVQGSPEMVDFNPNDPLINDSGITFEYKDLKIEIDELEPAREEQDEHTARETIKQEKIRQKAIKAESRKKLCPICNTNVNALTTHLLTHKEYQPFQCEYCSRTFSIMYNLKKHIRRHLQLKTFICSYCDKGFTNSAELNVHIRIHTNERPYKCKECDKSFRTSGSVTRHVKTHHRGIRPYTCEVCQAQFTLAAHLKRHMLRHTMERPYSCSICLKKYARPDLLKAHSCRA